MTTTLVIIAVFLLLPVVGVRLLFLAPTRWGWIPYFANVFSESFVKKVRWPRGAVEFVLVLAALGLLRWTGLAWAWVLLIALGVAGLELYVRALERRLLIETGTPLDRVGARHVSPEATHGLATGYPGPSTHPELTINLVGPFVERAPAYRLGTLVVGREFELCLVLGNHTIIATQSAIRVRVTAPTTLACEQEFGERVPRLGAGEVHELRQRWKVNAVAGAGTILFELAWGERQETLEVSFDGCVAAESVRASTAKIRRYPGACRAAFAWRGDMDLYDESTLQSIEGLEVTFGLAARYRVPQTMFLSSRLSLDEAAAREWAAHYGIDRGAARIPAFVDWMQANVELRHQCGYPFRSAKRFVVELGNHGHLHYGTDTSGAVENGWKLKARMGAGVYPWLGEDHSSLAEQRDNALETRRWFERCFQFTPRSWAMPDRTNDRYTAAAMEAAGCEVLSGSNTRPRSNVMVQPPPHHPAGTSAVELTNRYPGDPQHVYHWAMVTFWLHRAYRRGIPMIFMCHQHLRQFAGYACTRFTEDILRQALSRFRGDLHVNTMFGIGKYWREVLSPQTARVTATLAERELILENAADTPFTAVPVEVAAADGVRYTLLVDLPAGRRRVLEAATGRLMREEAVEEAAG
jgi:hypothetical protein